MKVLLDHVKNPPSLGKCSLIILDALFYIVFQHYNFLLEIMVTGIMHSLSNVVTPDVYVGAV